MAALPITLVASPLWAHNIRAVSLATRVWGFLCDRVAHQKPHRIPRSYEKSVYENVRQAERASVSGFGHSLA